MADMDPEPAEQSPPSAARSDASPPSLDAAVGSVAQEAALFLRALREHGDPTGRASDEPPPDDTPGAAPTPAPGARRAMRSHLNRVSREFARGWRPARTKAAKAGGKASEET